MRPSRWHPAASLDGLIFTLGEHDDAPPGMAAKPAER
jgi:hypothetical protein